MDNGVWSSLRGTVENESATEHDTNNQNNVKNFSKSEQIFSSNFCIDILYFI